MSIKTMKKLVAWSLTIVMTASSASGIFPVTVKADTPAITLPEAVYEWNFESALVDGTTVKNKQDTSDTSGEATLIGENAAIVNSSERDSQVLKLNGGSAGTGYLRLPESLYVGAGNGFTLSMEIKLDNSANSYSRIFQSANTEFGETGNTSYRDPEFSIVSGGDAYNSSISVGTAKTVADYITQLKWNENLPKDQWKNLTISVDKDNYGLYLDGKKINYSEISQWFSTAALDDTLTKLFANGYLSTLTYNAIGRSVYTDGDICAEFDNIKFFHQALTEQEVEYMVTGVVTEEPSVEIVTVPYPYYEYTFEEGTITDKKVQSTYNANTGEATLGGKNVTVEANKEKDSTVLNLPGDSLDSGYLTLPSNLYDSVTDGFTFAFWMKVDEEAAHYNRIFTSSVQELNSDGGGSWNAPEFTFVAGGTDTSSGRYDTSIMLKDRATATKLIWEKEFAREQWQYVTVSVSKNSYDVYMDGEKVNYTPKDSNLTKVLGTLFDSELAQYEYNAIGRSIYSTDNDLKAKIDDFRFYNTALNKNQAYTIYQSYAVEESVLEQLISKIETANSYSPSFYTWETYRILMEAIRTAEAVLQKPISAGNVNDTINMLEVAIQGLVIYKNLDPNSGQISRLQLDDVLKIAKEQAKLPYTAESLAVLNAAIEAAEALTEGATQKEIDVALLALRAALDQLTYGATLNFDTTKSTGEILHGSTGFLYGVSEINVPSMDLLSGIQPKILVQKAADGKQHPSGDGYRLTSYLEDAGVENLQIYLQDYYLEWPYDYDEDDRIGDYQAKVKSIVSKMIEGKTEAEKAFYSYVIFNEPDQIWYGSSESQVKQMCEDWLVIYKTIKELDPKAKIAGPNFAGYNSTRYEQFFKFCQQNNCLPEYITWHELQKDKLTSYQSHYEHMQGLIKTYYAGSGITPIIFINETVNFEDVGAPGPLVNWIAVFEETKVYSALPYWGLANSLNELAAETNKPNGAWWIYKWYADMQGNTIAMEKENIEAPSSYGSLYGLSSVDEKNSTVYTLFGGQAGSQAIQLNNLTQVNGFENATSAHVKIYSTKYTGHHGFADDIPVEYEGNIALKDGNLDFAITDAQLMDAYFAIVTPATDDQTTLIADYETNWTKTYEAENATMIGNAQSYTKTDGSDLARSNRAEVGNLNTENDGVEFSVNVPKDGTYKLQVYYSSQAPAVNAVTLEEDANGQNRAIGKVTQHKLIVDNNEEQLLDYESTVKWGYYNYKTVYLDLTAGTHIVTLMHAGEDQTLKGSSYGIYLCALLDKIDLTYDSEIGDPLMAKQAVIEPEEVVGRNDNYTFSKEKEGYQGSGYAIGKGSFTMNVVVPEDGLYDASFLYQSDANGTINIYKSKMNYAKDAKAASEVKQEWLSVGNATVKVGGFLTGNFGQIYLTAGANTIQIRSDKTIKLDQFSFVKNQETTNDNTITVEAEAGTLSGDAKVLTNNYASDNAVVDGIGGGSTNNKMSIQVNVKKAGNYKLSMFYSNNEPAPIMKDKNSNNYVHPYNTDLVERYAQIAVNGNEPETVYFRNTLSWDVFKNVVIDVPLKAGTNTIVISNDNSYKFSEVVDDYAPRFDKFVITPASMSEAAETGSSSGGGGSAPQTGTTEEPVITENKKTPEIVEKINLYVGKTVSLKGKISGLEEDAKITYATAQNKIVTLGKTTGNVKGSKAGTAKITITIEQNGETYKITTKVVVKDPYVKITKSVSSIKVGKQTTFAAKAYGISKTITWTVSNKKLAAINSKTGKFTAKKVGTVTVTATCGKYKISKKITIKPR